VNCHCKLEENPVGNVEPMQLVVQYLTKTAIKLPSAGMRACVLILCPACRRLLFLLYYCCFASFD